MQPAQAPGEVLSERAHSVLAATARLTASPAREETLGCVWPVLSNASTTPRPTVSDSQGFSCVDDLPFPTHGSKGIIKRSLLIDQAAVTPPHVAVLPSANSPASWVQSRCEGDCLGTILAPPPEVVSLASPAPLSFLRLNSPTSGPFLTPASWKLLLLAACQPNGLPGLAAPPPPAPPLRHILFFTHLSVFPHMNQTPENRHLDCLAHAASPWHITGAGPRTHGEGKRPLPCRHQPKGGS